MIEIDGSTLEGGGQILRLALCFSAILKKPVGIFNIRANRPKPGLAAQHKQGIELLRDICSAKVTGCEMGSTVVEFHPNKISGGKYFADTKTAGATSLLMQIALPVCIFGDREICLDLKGGTNADMAPQVDYITEIFRPHLEKFGTTFDFELHRRGYFPKGGGHVAINVKPVQYLNSVTLTDFGTINRFFGWSFVAGSLPIKLADDMVLGARKVFKQAGNNLPIDIEAYKEDPKIANANCSGIILGCETNTNVLLGGSALGSRKESSFTSGEKAAKEIMDAVHVRACVDRHMQDQLIIFMALARGKSIIRTEQLTMHTKTAIYMAEIMANVKFNVKDSENSTILLECDGIGVKNTSL